MVIAGVASLWRNFRYDKENPANRFFDKLPYFFRKSLTCGLCFTFWTAFVYNILFEPLGGWLSRARFVFSGQTESVLAFLVSWMVVGTGAALVLYLLDTLFEVSHYYKHRAHHDTHS